MTVSPYKLLGYTVINEFGSPYITADLKFQGTEIPSKDEYITLVQTDFETGQQKIIFRGFPIEVSWKLKKDLVEASVKAVTNAWYLTQQMPSEWESSSLPYEEKLNAQPWDEMYYYPRMNEIMLMWDWMNFIPSKRQIPGSSEQFSNFEQDARGFNSWYSKWSAKMIATKWNYMTGVAPSYELADEISDIVSTYMPCKIPLSYDLSCYDDIPDCRSNSTDPKEWAFDDFKTTKYNGIMQFCDYCDRIFHTRIAQTDYNMTVRQPPYGSYDKGTLVAYWTRNTSANSINGPEPFNVLLNISALTDNTLLEIHKEERSTDRSKPNVVKVGSIEAVSYYSSGYERNESSYPCEWWQQATGQIECGPYWWRNEKPVEHFKMVENLSQNEVEDYAEEYYERLQQGQDKYTASLLSTICERESPYRSILPGSRIRVCNVSNHTDDEMRIMKIIHKKDGAKPATTELEYYNVYDLAHPNIFAGSNILDRIMVQTEKNVEGGPRVETYQNIANPRKIGTGIPTIGIIEIENTTTHLADVRLYNTSGILKNVILTD